MTINRSDEIAARISRIRQRVASAADRSGRKAEDIHVMAVTKGMPAVDVQAAARGGITLFGENRAQEFLRREKDYPFDKSHVHFIGHLQKNKVRSIIEKVGMIQSIDSCSLAETVNREAARSKRCIPVLLQVNIGKEETKSGFLSEEIPEAIKRVVSLPSLTLQGLMCIPPKENTNYYFQKMFALFVDNSCLNVDNNSMKYLSMGMSRDFEEAIQNGSNLIRLGKAIFEI